MRRLEQMRNTMLIDACEEGEEKMKRYKTTYTPTSNSLLMTLNNLNIDFTQVTMLAYFYRSTTNDFGTNTTSISYIGAGAWVNADKYPEMIKDNITNSTTSNDTVYVHNLLSTNVLSNFNGRYALATANNGVYSGGSVTSVTPTTLTLHAGNYLKADVTYEVEIFYI